MIPGGQRHNAPPHIRELCLTLWAARVPSRDIARRCGFSDQQQVRSLITHQRSLGEPRAARRNFPVERPERPKPQPSDTVKPPLRCPELGIESVTVTMPNVIPMLQQQQPLVTISVPRVRFLEGRI